MNRRDLKSGILAVLFLGGSAGADPVDMNGEASGPIVVEQTFDSPVAAVWRAITDDDRMRRWFFEPIEEFEPREGFETRFTVTADDREFEHLWKVIDVIPGKRIAYEWQYAGIPGSSIVTWELSEAPEGTRLKLTHSGVETFPRDDPVFSREQGLAGWRYFIQESLRRYLEPHSAP